MKLAPLFFFIALSAISTQTYAKENCSVFRANFLGLEWALENCEMTPKIQAWIKEERERKANESKQEYK